MNHEPVIHSSYEIVSQFPAAPDRVFAALAEPAKKRLWYASPERPGSEHEMDFRVGGKEVARSIIGGGPLAGVPMVAESVYLDIQPGRRVVLAATMTVGERRISASLLTFEVQAIETGSELIFTEQAAFFEGADGPEMRQHGWRHLLSGLDKAL